MPKGDRITVLIVDDIVDTRDNLRKLLYFERDIEVVGDVGRGEDALQKARELRPDVVLMDINLPGIDGITATEAIRAQAPTVQVIMMSVQGEAEYLRRAMLAGAREFLVKPFSSEELAGSIRRVHDLARDLVPMSTVSQLTASVAQESAKGDGGGQIISVFSAKGGVGRTTIACNLAVVLRTVLGKKVALVDGSLQFGDVGVVLNLQGSKTIVDLTQHLANLEPELIEGVMVRHSSGMRVLLPPPRPEMAELVTAEALKRILAKLREMYDFVVVDTWSSFQDTVLAVLDSSDRIIVPFTLEIPAIKNVKLFLEVADALDYPPDKVLLVINRADSPGGIRIGDVEENLRRRIPFRLMSEGRLATYTLNRGVPVVLNSPESQLARSIVQLAQHIGNPAGSDTAVPSAVEDVNKAKGKTLGGLFTLPKLGSRSSDQATAASH